MRLIKEPLNVDFVVESRPLTEKEKLTISEYIRMDKEKRRQREQQKKSRIKRIKPTHHT
ncbi:hypothetical protein LJC11_04350 [Bacteroidales bacterium OttesenSCG-928-I21]|nr:hypothetical protein [Bacteroidales bacterium OttesenSCG-928-I21]